MQALRQLGGGVIIALISIILVIGGISLALAESSSPPSVVTPIQIPPTLQLIFPTSTLSLASTQTQIPTQTATVFPTSTISIPPTACTPPGGWFQTVVGATDTIYSLAQRYNTSEDALKNANCLTSLDLQAGNVLYVPPVATVYVVPCGPPAGWVKTHVVQAGENLFRISLSYGITTLQLQAGNCMGSSITIYSGQRLWVPNRPTLTPGITILPNFPTSTTTQTPTNTTVPTSTPVPPTATATQTFIVTSSPLPTATQSNTPPAINTQTPSITAFPSP